jgi:hypothetical protein
MPLNRTACFKNVNICLNINIYSYLDTSVACIINLWIVNADSRVITKLETSLTDDAGVIIYDRHMFIVQATGGQSSSLYLNVVHFFNTSVN